MVFLIYMYIRLPILKNLNPIAIKFSAKNLLSGYLKLLKCMKVELKNVDGICAEIIHGRKVCFSQLHK